MPIECRPALRRRGVHRGARLAARADRRASRRSSDGASRRSIRGSTRAFQRGYDPATRRRTPRATPRRLRPRRRLGDRRDRASRAAPSAEPAAAIERRRGRRRARGRHDRRDPNPFERTLVGHRGGARSSSAVDAGRLGDQLELRRFRRHLGVRTSAAAGLVGAVARRDHGRARHWRRSRGPPAIAWRHAGMMPTQSVDRRCSGVIGCGARRRSSARAAAWTRGQSTLSASTSTGRPISSRSAAVRRCAYASARRVAGGARRARARRPALLRGARPRAEPRRSDRARRGTRTVSAPGSTRASQRDDLAELVAVELELLGLRRAATLSVAAAAGSAASCTSRREVDDLAARPRLRAARRSPRRS